MKPLLMVLALSVTVQAQLPKATPPPGRKWTFAEKSDMVRLIQAIGLPPTKEQITAALRDKMRDPDSLVVERIGDVKLGVNTDLRFWYVSVDYRANNGAGGVNRKTGRLEFYGSHVSLHE